MPPYQIESDITDSDERFFTLGAYLTAKVSTHWIAIVFGIVLLYSAIASFRHKPERVPDAANRTNTLADNLKLKGQYPTPDGREAYTAQRVPLGFGIMFGAGTLSGIFHGALQLDPQSIVQLGLVVLIATPVARVVLCLIGFARQRSALYVAISSIVLAILAYSLASNLR